jgi:hypothetical protein
VEAVVSSIATVATALLLVLIDLLVLSADDPTDVFSFAWMYHFLTPSFSSSRSFAPCSWL